MPLHVFVYSICKCTLLPELLVHTIDAPSKLFFIYFLFGKLRHLWLCATLRRSPCASHPFRPDVRLCPSNTPCSHLPLYFCEHGNRPPDLRPSKGLGATPSPLGNRTVHLVPCAFSHGLPCQRKTSLIRTPTHVERRVRARAPYVSPGARPVPVGHREQSRLCRVRPVCRAHSLAPPLFRRARPPTPGELEGKKHADAQCFVVGTESTLQLPDCSACLTA